MLTFPAPVNSHTANEMHRQTLTQPSADLFADVHTVTFWTRPTNRVVSYDMLQCRCMLTIYVLVPVLVSSPVSEGKSTQTGATHCIWVSARKNSSFFKCLHHFQISHPQCSRAGRVPTSGAYFHNKCCCKITSGSLFSVQISFTSHTHCT